MVEGRGPYPSKPDHSPTERNVLWAPYTIEARGCTVGSKAAKELGLMIKPYPRNFLLGGFGGFGVGSVHLHV